MVNENKELRENLKYYKETEKEEVHLSKILKYANFFTSIIKQNAAWSKSFTDIFTSKESFILDIKNENLKKVSKDLLEFILQTFAELEEITALSSSSYNSKDQATMQAALPTVRRNTAPTLNRDISHIHNDSEILAQNISAQKLKILKIYDSVKEGLNKSRNMLDASTNPIVQATPVLDSRIRENTY